MRWILDPGMIMLILQFVDDKGNYRNYYLQFFLWKEMRPPFLIALNFTSKLKLLSLICLNQLHLSQIHLPLLLIPPHLYPFPLRLPLSLSNHSLTHLHPSLLNPLRLKWLVEEIVADPPPQSVTDTSTSLPLQSVTLTHLCVVIVKTSVPSLVFCNFYYFST